MKEGGKYRALAGVPQVRAKVDALEYVSTTHVRLCVSA